MKRRIVFALNCLLELVALAACTGMGIAGSPTVTAAVPATSVAEATRSATKVPPTPASLGWAVVYDDLQLTVESAELSTDYVTEYGSNREPPAGQKFLWVQVTLENIGSQARDLPATEHYSALFAATEFKPTYGHRKEHLDYTGLSDTVYPEQPLDAWLRFDVPTASELTTLQFAYLPDSSQITNGFSPTDYAWADHPVFLWNLAPK